MIMIRLVFTILCFVVFDSYACSEETIKYDFISVVVNESKTTKSFDLLMKEKKNVGLIIAKAPNQQLLVDLNVEKINSDTFSTTILLDNDSVEHAYLSFSDSGITSFCSDVVKLTKLLENSKTSRVTH